MGYAISTTVRGGFDETLARTRSALAEQGFGVLTEIDLAATLKKKLDADIPAQVILGACNPQAPRMTCAGMSASSFFFNVAARSISVRTPKPCSASAERVLARVSSNPPRTVVLMA